MTAQDVAAELRKHADPERALFATHFFKTGEGEYGAGDVFIGVTMPQTRLVAKQFRDLPLGEIQKLLTNKTHELRMVGLIILTLLYAKSDAHQKQKIYDFYLLNVQGGCVNNWDLVDATAPYIVGEFLQSRPRKILFKLARSDDLWPRRVAIISTFAFLKRGDAGTTLGIAEILLNDEQDLIQKAVGWALREVGKRVDRQLLLSFLDEHAHEMPRTMLRYSLEHLPAEQRVYYMKRKQAKPRRV